MSAEDGLRLLCLHLWASRAWRPLWLCDIAMLLELQGAEVDWDLLLRGPGRAGDWVLRALQLAHVLLGARLDGTPLAAEEARLPGWVAPEVLGEWERCALPPLAPMGRFAREHAREPLRVARELAGRWRSPLAAAAELGLTLDERPRLPHQAAATVRGALRALHSQEQAGREP